MKRAHSDSNLLPYEYRQQQQINTNHLPASSRPVHDDHLSFLPQELLVKIFSDTSSAYQCLRSLALTCRSFKMAVYSDAFRNMFLEAHTIPLKLKDVEPWMKTYRLWLQTKYYILWDCSNSMITYPNETLKIINQIAAQAFKNQWCGGISLGFFAGGFKFHDFATEDALKSYLSADLDDIFMDFDFIKTQTDIIPPLLEIYKWVNSQPSDNASATEVHVITDYDFDFDYKTHEIITYMQDSTCLNSLIINFYVIDKYSGSNFLDKLKSLPLQISNIQNRPKISVIYPSED